MLRCEKCPCWEFADEIKFFCATLDRTMYQSPAELCRTRDDYRKMFMERENIEEEQAAKPPSLTRAELTDAAERLAEEIGDPTLVEKAISCTRAVARWVRAGCPCRTREEVQQIYTEHCEPCEYRDRKRDVCTICGCGVSKTAIVVAAKLWMATEKCPRKKWRAKCAKCSKCLLPRR